MVAVGQAQSFDPARDALGELLGALRLVFGDQPFTSAEIMNELPSYSANPRISYSFGSMSPKEINAERLHDAIQAISPVALKNVTSLGKILSFRKGRISRGFSIEQSTNNHDKVAKWQIVKKE